MLETDYEWKDAGGKSDELIRDYAIAALGFGLTSVFTFLYFE